MRVHLGITPRNNSLSPSDGEEGRVAKLTGVTTEDPLLSPALSSIRMEERESASSCLGYFQDVDAGRNKFVLHDLSSLLEFPPLCAQISGRI
jgi:hypothetical protein